MTLKLVSIQHLMPIKARTMMTVCQLKFKSGFLTRTEILLDVDITGTEMENDIPDETDFQEDDLASDNIDALECQLKHNLAALFLRR